MAASCEAESKSDPEVPDWKLASDGIKLFINNKCPEAEQLFLQRPDSVFMYYGYAFAVFMDALMSYEEDKLSLAVTALKEVEKKCTSETGWLKNITSFFGNHNSNVELSTAERLEREIILADSQVYLAILIFVQQDVSGFLKGGWVLRKAWKVYQKTYREILGIYKELVGDLQVPEPLSGNFNLSQQLDGENSYWTVPDAIHEGYSNSKLPHSASANLNSLKSSKTTVKKSISMNSALSSHSNNNQINNNNNNKSFWGFQFSSSHSLQSLSFFSQNGLFNNSNANLQDSSIDIFTIKRLMGAISFGYGLFQLGVSLLPPQFMKLLNLLGFSGNRQNGIACLMYARLGVDLRAPLATLSLLWYHTIVRPFYAIDGRNVEAGVEAATQLLNESQEQYKESALFLFFKGRLARLKSDIPLALKSFEQAVDNSTQRELKLLSLHEVVWCHIIIFDYKSANEALQCLKTSSRWSRAFYTYLSVICIGSFDPQSMNNSVLDDLSTNLKSTPKGNPLEDFLNKRSKIISAAKEQEKKLIFWQLFIYELLFLWNALPSCAASDLRSVIENIQSNVENDKDEPMLGLSKLIIGCCCTILNLYDEGVANLKMCLDSRQILPLTAEDAHVSAFAQYELAALLIKKPETKEEGKSLLQQMNQYHRYDFDQRLNLRVHSIIRQL